MLTPIALFVFNRPDTTRLVAEAIAKANPPKILVVADGPREDCDEDQSLCERTRLIIEEVFSNIPLVKNYSNVNMGCRARVASGLDWVFSQEKEAIILEDDCLPDPSFFPYCEDLLEKYRDNNKVHMISGNNLLFGREYCAESYYFSRFYKIWGWASWARAWKFYDLSMEKWPGLRDTNWLEDYLPDKRMAAKARRIFDETYNGTLTTWEYQWVFASWLENAVSVVPRRNLIKNIGFGSAATHMLDQSSPLGNLNAYSVDFPLSHPEDVKILEKADLKEWELLNRQGCMRRARSKLRSILGC